MKKSELDKIIAAASQKELLRIQKEFDAFRKSDDLKDLGSIFGFFAGQIPDVAARTAADILVKTGVIKIEDG